MAIGLLRRHERRVLSPQTIFRTGVDTLGYSRNETGINVNVETAFALSAFWACVRLLTADTSTLPGKAFREEKDVRIPLERQPAWIERPDPFDPSVTRIDHFAQVAVSLLTDGNSYTLAEPSVIEPESLTVLPPDTVTPRKNGRLPEYAVRDGGGRTLRVLGPDNIVHIALFRRPGAVRGQNPIAAAQEGIGLGLATQRWAARFFAAGASMPGFIEVPAETSQVDLDKMAEELTKRHGGWKKAGLMGFLTGGAKFNPTGIKPADADLTGLRKYQLEEMARLFGIPPHMIGSQEPGAVAYASVEQRSIDYVVHTLRHYVEPIEAAYSRLIPGDGRLAVAGSNTYFKFNVGGLLRGDIGSRYSAYATGLLNGFLSIDDVRRLEDLAPVKGGDVHRVQSQMVDIAAPPPEPAPVQAPAPVAEEPTRQNPVVINIPPGETHVSAPDVHVAAPVVNVPAAEVHVAAPEVHVAPTDYAPLLAALDRSNEATVSAIRELLEPEEPARKRIVRDAAGRIVEVIEQRGSRITKRTVERDPDGRIIEVV